MNINKFDIWLADLNPRQGTEPGKIRPVLILQNNALNKKHPSSIVCPITTKVQIESKILRVNIEKGDSGLNESCDIMIDQIRAIDNKRLIKKLGHLKEELNDIVERNIKIVLDIE